MERQQQPRTVCTITSYFLVIQAGRFDTARRLVSRALPRAGAGAGADGAGAAAGALLAAGAASPAGAGWTPLGFTPYGFGVPTGGDQAP